MLGEQEHILDCICRIVQSSAPDAVLIAGDIYDKAIPSADAVMLFDDFLVRLSSGAPHIFIISGNHDSAERNAFGARLLDDKGIHISPVYDGNINPVTISDEWGPVDIFMLPYLKPPTVRHILPEEEKGDADSYNAAISKAVGLIDIDKSRRNIIVTHQFVTGSDRCDSEDINIGGLDNVDASVFDDFDYVALGHLHRPQNCGKEHIRYCGSPLKYSFSEVQDKKSVTIAELGPKGSLEVNVIPLIPLHDWHDLRGTYAEVASHGFYSGTPYQEDFVRITLTDEEDIPDAAAKLRSIYHNLMEIRYDNRRTRAGHSVIDGASDSVTKSPLELFSELYRKQNGDDMTDEQKQYVESLITQILEGKI